MMPVLYIVAGLTLGQLTFWFTLGSVVMWRTFKGLAGGG
jgi:hypothetical protein